MEEILLKVKEAIKIAWDNLKNTFKKIWENVKLGLNKDDFENWSDPYNELSELSHKLNLELIAKNIDLRISLK